MTYYIYMLETDGNLYALRNDKGEHVAFEQRADAEQHCKTQADINDALGITFNHLADLHGKSAGMPPRQLADMIAYKTGLIAGLSGYRDNRWHGMSKRKH